MRFASRELGPLRRGRRYINPSRSMKGRVVARSPCLSPRCGSRILDQLVHCPNCGRQMSSDHEIGRRGWQILPLGFVLAGTMAFATWALNVLPAVAQAPDSSFRERLRVDRAHGDLDYRCRRPDDPGSFEPRRDHRNHPPVRSGIHLRRNSRRRRRPKVMAESGGQLKIDQKWPETDGRLAGSFCEKQR